MGRRRRRLPPRASQLELPKGCWFMVVAESGRREGEFPWTPAAVADLKVMYANGSSSSAIAMELSGRYKEKLTRSAVIGKINRLHLRGTRGKETDKGGRNNKARKKKEPMPRVVKNPAAPSPLRFVVPPTLGNFNTIAPDHQTRNVTMDQLNSKTCRWPLGGMEDRPPYLYCGGAVTEKGASYCAHHMRINVDSRYKRWARG